MAARRNTQQKEIIRHTLCRMCCHPTAVAVFEEVRRTHPTISRSTVYRVLGQLTEEGEILRLHLAGEDERYDGNTSRHSHVRCTRCGAVADIPAVAMEEPAETRGYLLTGCVVEYAGVCPRCQAASDS
ncbi:MAG: transcriptional repressor [Oscillospiraceae bacterium]|nr:transcriptional repressor [Oscillospiraceae bacterium]